jgi:hypothetical protein
MVLVVVTTLDGMATTTAGRIGAHRLEPPGPQFFSQDIRNASFPTQFQQPTNVTKYSGKMNPELWLDDYHLAC